jgi:hypothetical protein
MVAQNCTISVALLLQRGEIFAKKFAGILQNIGRNDALICWAGGNAQLNLNIR